MTNDNSEPIRYHVWFAPPTNIVDFILLLFEEMETLAAKTFSNRSDYTDTTFQEILFSALVHRMVLEGLSKKSIIDYFNEELEESFVLQKKSDEEDVA